MLIQAKRKNFRPATISMRTLISQVFEPALTTVAQPMQALGASAVEVLLAQFRGETPASRTLPHTLTLRETA